MYPYTIFTGDVAPTQEPPCWFPWNKREVAEEELQRMVDMDVIEPSDSPWAAPVCLVAKKDGSIWLCIDYRRLNAVTHKDSFPLPRIDDTLQALEGSSWFSTLDLTNGYWQVTMSPEDASKTAFATGYGSSKCYPWDCVMRGLHFKGLCRWYSKA
jgi:hypothetical protein